MPHSILKYSQIAWATSITVCAMFILIFNVLVEKEPEILREKENIQMLLQDTFLSSRKSVVSVRDWSGLCSIYKQLPSGVPLYEVIRAPKQ